MNEARSFILLGTARRTFYLDATGAVSLIAATAPRIPSGMSKR
jgi:hypothetical protein